MLDGTITLVLIGGMIMVLLLALQSIRAERVRKKELEEFFESIKKRD